MPTGSNGTRAGPTLRGLPMGATQLAKATRLTSGRWGFWYFHEWLRRHYGRRFGDAWAAVEHEGGVKMLVQPAHYVGGKIFWQGALSRDELAYATKRIRPGQTFIDVGANVGEWSLLAAKHGARVLAFEPQHDLANAIRWSIDNNGPQASTIDVYEMCLGAKDGHASLWWNPSNEDLDVYNEGNVTMVEHPSLNRLPGKVTVRRFDGVFAETGLQAIDWMKVDVEGGEIDVLDGARESIAAHKPNLIIEASQVLQRKAGRSVKELHETVRSLGYADIRTLGKNATTHEASLDAEFANWTCTP
jgi:FkbM family methyltransferase